MRYLFSIILTLFALQVQAQYTFSMHITDAQTHQPLVGAIVNEKLIAASTDDNGIVNLTNLSAGKHTFILMYTGYTTDSITVTLPDNKLHEATLSSSDKGLEEVTIVSSTRTNERMENAPVKVEVLGLEEMSEENTIKPGNIGSLLGDVSGVQIQQSSAVSGNSNVRIQGLDGRYTQIVRDGMPLFDGFSGGFGILQIPPLDLKQIEFIKGSASTLYGGGAIGGFINLISKRPTETQEGSFTFNHSTLTESNVNTYFAKRYHKFGYTLFIGATHQDAVDVDKDGFSDVPKLDAFIFHPRLFFYPSDKTTIIAGYSGAFEHRLGGDMQVVEHTTDSSHHFFEEDQTQRHTGEFIIEHELSGYKKLYFKSSVSSFTRDIHSYMMNIKGDQLNYYSELSLFIPQGKNSFVCGLNAVGDQFHKQHTDSVIALPDFHNNTIGFFAQYTAHLPYDITLESGLRSDLHDQYGNFLLPRIALFHRFNDAWATRMGIGMGYKTPNLLVVQNVEYPIQYIQPLLPGIKAEQSIGYNIEGNYKKEFSSESSFFINVALFLTQISDPIVATQYADKRVFFSNYTGDVSTEGTDMYVKMKVKGVEIYAGYTYTNAVRGYLSRDQYMPLTPRNKIAFTALKEVEAKWRFGIEGSYTGPQYRDGDSNTPGYFFMAAMIQRKFGEAISIVLNVENLLDYRQSTYETLYTGSRLNPDFKPLWASIEGRVANVSLVIKPFAKKAKKDKD
ncbi:MAG: TonB-dependent receptor [Bacteroidota bacterium]